MEYMDEKYDKGIGYKYVYNKESEEIKMAI